MELPRRYSLATQAAASIREGIASGIWRDSLPGERHLCRFLQISRPTLRAAIDILRHEGLVEVRHRQNTLITASDTQPPPTPGAVVLITGRPLHQQAADMVSFVGELQHTLAQSGLRLILIEEAQLARENPPRKLLEKVAFQHPALCHVLLSVSATVQRFFSDLRLPTFVRGSRFEQVLLPSSEWDYEAMGRHAAGYLLSRGHQRLGLILPADLRTGDLRCQHGFEETLNRDAAPTHCVAIRATGRALQLHRKLEKLFHQPDRPTGIFVFNPYDGVTTLFALQQLGLAVPGDVSLISCETASIFSVFPFGVTCYSVHFKLIDKSVKLVLKLALNRVLPPNENLIMPDFHPGDTVSKASGP